MQCCENRFDGSKSRFVVLALGCIFSACTILAASTAIAADVQASARPSARTKPVETTVSKPAEDAKKGRGIHAAPPRALRSEAAIRKALEATADLDFTKTPLDDIMGAIGDFTKIDIVLDKKALADIGMPSDLPMTVSLRGISVRAALDLILRNLNLTWVVRDEVILITTPEEADNWIETRVYDVSDLVLPQSSYPFDGMYIPEARGGKSGPAAAWPASPPGRHGRHGGEGSHRRAAGRAPECSPSSSRFHPAWAAEWEAWPAGMGGQGSEPAKPSSPAPRKEPPKPATPGGMGGRGRRGGMRRRNGRHGRRNGRHGRRFPRWKCWRAGRFRGMAARL